MDIKQFIKYARKVLNEDAGSEGMQYKITAKSGLKSYKDDVLSIEDLVTEDGITSATISFTYPHDYGFAINTIKEVLQDIEIVSLSLVY